MVKKIKTYFEEKNFSVTKNVAKGNIGGFDVTFVQHSSMNSHPYQVVINCYQTEEAKIELINSLIAQKNKYVVYFYTLFGISFSLTGVTVNSMLKKLDLVLNNVIDELNKREFKGNEYCPYCGELLSEDYDIINDGEVSIKIDKTCHENVNNLLKDEQKEFDELPNNYANGFAGAFLGAIAGAAIMVILYFIGYVAAISALVSFGLGVTLYKKFGGKPNGMMILIVSVTSIVILFLAYMGIYVLAADSLCVEKGVSLTGVKAFKYCMKGQEFKRSFYGDLALQALFACVGMGYSVYAALKNVKRVKSI